IDIVDGAGRFANKFKACPVVRGKMLSNQIELRMTECQCFWFLFTDMLVKIGHQERCGSVFEFPKCGYNAFGTRFYECINEVCYAFLPHRANAGVTRRESDKGGIEVKVANLADLEEPIVRPLGLRRKNKCGTIRIVGIHVAMKGKMEDAVILERKIFEMR